MTASINTKLKNGEEFSFVTFGPKKETDDELLAFLTEICEFYNIPGFVSIFFTLVKDLVLNGYKANFKRVFFRENKMNIESPAEYELGVRRFKSLLQQGKTAGYLEKAQNLGFFVEIRFQHNPTEILVEVRNNNPLAKGEMTKIKHSLFHAQNYNDIMEYFIERGDNSEGEGIGIALCVILLKGEGIETDNFKIFSNEVETVASIRIPVKSIKN